MAPPSRKKQKTDAPKLPNPKVLTTSSTAPIFAEPGAEIPDQWGFVCYRTTYLSTSDWDAAIEKLSAVFAADLKNVEGDDDPDTSTIKYVSNKEELDGKTVREVRLIHNPGYKPRRKQRDDEDDEAYEEFVEAFEAEIEPPGARADGLCGEVCLMIDEEALQSILAHKVEGEGTSGGDDDDGEGDVDDEEDAEGDDEDEGNEEKESKPGYVVAIDVTTEISEQATVTYDSDAEEEVEGTALAKIDGSHPSVQMTEVKWDGTMKVDIASVFDEFYCRSVGNGALSMGEIHPAMGEIWSYM